jgi:energy-coupling factor transporter ATP-binding protein EcfA2
MQELPVPVRDGSIELLRPFCNVSESGFTLFVAVLLAGLRPRSNYPVVVVTGEQGTGKSSLVRILARLIGPRMPEQRSTPRTEEDLLVGAAAQHVLSFDNVSGLPDWLSDAICRLSTGGGAGKRQLYTDTDEILFSGRRLIAINGIEDVAVRPDLVDRAVMLALEPIAEKRRRDEAEYKVRPHRAQGPWRTARRRGDRTARSRGHRHCRQATHGRFRAMGGSLHPGLLASRDIPGGISRQPGGFS